MKPALFIMSILTLSACGSGGGRSDETASEANTPSTEVDNFNLHNVRFDSKDYYDEELVTVTEGTSFEVQWVSPSSSSYKIDLYLSTNGEAYSDKNKIVGLKCGSDSFSLCPNATGEVLCEINSNILSCSIGSKPFQDEDQSSLKFIIKGCDALSNCDVKTFNLSIQENTDDSSI